MKMIKNLLNYIYDWIMAIITLLMLLPLAILVVYIYITYKLWSRIYKKVKKENQ